MGAQFHFKLDSKVTPLSSSKVYNTNLAEFGHYQDFHMGKIHVLVRLLFTAYLSRVTMRVKAL